MSPLQLHRVADPRTDRDAFDAMDEASDHHAQHAHEVRRLAPAPAPEDQSEPAGIGSVLLIALAFLLFALFCVWCAAVTAGVPVEDVLREIWAAGRVRL